MPAFAFRSRTRRRTVLFGSAGWLAVLLMLGPAPAGATLTTIGQLAPGSPPPTTCNNGDADVLQPNVPSGNSYVVPTDATTLVSWSTNAAAGDGQTLTMKVYRKIGDPMTYVVVAHDGPRPLAPGTVNTFPVNITVQPGDVIGLDPANADAVNNACLFPAPEETYLFNEPALADGASAAFDTGFNSRMNVTGVVGQKPENDFSFGKVKRNKDKGTARLAVAVPGPGMLVLTGKGVKTQRSGRATATASKAVSAAGTVRLQIKPKGKKKRRLNDHGKVKVKLKVTFTPTGDLPGIPNTQTKRVKLIKHH